MNILVIGSGGREHTFAYKIAQSSKTNELFIAPGNAGTSELGTNLPISVSDFDGIKSAVLETQYQVSCGGAPKLHWSMESMTFFNLMKR